MKGYTTTGVLLRDPFFCSIEKSAQSFCIGDSGKEREMIVNGEKTVWTPGLTVDKLLESGNYRKDRVAVEKNGEIVPKKNYSSEEILEEDRIEIVSFVGGG